MITSPLVIDAGRPARFVLSLLSRPDRLRGGPGPTASMFNLVDILVPYCT